MDSHLIIFCLIAGFTGGGCYMACASVWRWAYRKWTMAKEKQRWLDQRARQHRLARARSLSGPKNKK